MPLDEPWHGVEDGGGGGEHGEDAGRARPELAPLQVGGVLELGEAEEAALHEDLRVADLPGQLAGRVDRLDPGHCAHIAKKALRLGQPDGDEENAHDSAVEGQLPVGKLRDLKGRAFIRAGATRHPSDLDTPDLVSQQAPYYGVKTRKPQCRGAGNPKCGDEFAIAMYEVHIWVLVLGPGGGRVWPGDPF